MLRTSDSLLGHARCLPFFFAAVTVCAVSNAEPDIWMPAFTYARKATWDETYAASLAASSVTIPVLGDWHYIGPFDNTGGTGFDMPYPPEEEVQLDRAYDGKGDQLVRWKPGDRFVDGRVNDLGALFDDPENSVVYLYRTIFCPVDMERVVSLGSDDTLTVWINGLKVLSKNIARGAAPDQDRVKLNLKQGDNELLLKICQGGGDWAFYFLLDATLPSAIEVPLLKRLIRDFPADPKVDAAYQRLYEIRRAVWRDQELPQLDLFGINVREFGASGVGKATNGTVDAGARVVTNVADTSTFRPGHGVYLWHFNPVDGVATVEAGQADFVASVRVLPQPGANPSEPGLAFRVADAGNYWALSAAFNHAASPSARVRLVRVRDGSPTELRAKDIERPSSPTAELALKVVLKGEQIQALVNDRALFELADRFNQTERKVGLYHNASHRAGSPIWHEFRVGAQIEDRFDRADNRYDLGKTNTGNRWQAQAGRWGTVGGRARRTEGATGEKLATIVTAVRESALEIAHPWQGEDNALIEVFHDDTPSLERALRIRAGEVFARARHLLLPQGGYNIARPLRLGPEVKLTGLNPAGGIGASINALPGFAPESDDERFILYWYFANTANAGENIRQSLENLRLAAIHPETNPGLSGVRLASGPGSRYTNVQVDVPRRGVVVAEGSADSLFETVEVRAGEACVDVLGYGVRSLTFRNLRFGLYDIGQAGVGLRLRSGAAGIIGQGLTSDGPRRPVLIQGGTDITLLGLNARGHPEYPIVEVQRARDDLALMVSGIARGTQKAVTVGGETVAWVRPPGEAAPGPRPFRFIGGQSSLWMGAKDGSGQVNFLDHVGPSLEIRGGESVVVDLIDTRSRGGGSAVYEYIVSTRVDANDPSVSVAGGADPFTVEVGTLTLLHNSRDFQVVRTVKGKVGPGAAESLFTPDAQMRDGLLGLRVRADVSDGRAIWFNAVKTGLGLPGPAPARVFPPMLAAAEQPISAPSRLGADGYLRDWLIIGPVPYQGDTIQGVLGHDDLNGERKIKPRPGDQTTIRGGKHAWVSVHSDAPHLDLNRVFLSPPGGREPSEWTEIENAFGYMVAYLAADREIPNLTLRLDFDDAVRLWLNGTEIVYDRDGNAVGGNGDPNKRLFDADVGEKALAYHGVQEGITLKTGVNVLVLKVANRTGRWAVGLRFKDLDGRPVRDCRVGTAPSAK